MIDHNADEPEKLQFETKKAKKASAGSKKTDASKEKEAPEEAKE